MKKIAFIAVLTALALSSCAGPALPTPDAAATAQAVFDAQPTITPQSIPTAQPAPTEAVLFVEYPDDRIRVFMDDADVSQQIEDAGGTLFGYMRGRLVTVVFSVPNDKLSDDVGTVYFVPRFAHPHFRFGGLGSSIVGSAVVGLNALDDVKYEAHCLWGKTPHGEDAIVFQYVDDADRLQTMRGNAGTSDFPQHFFYGPFARCTIQIP